MRFERPAVCHLRVEGCRKNPLSGRPEVRVVNQRLVIMKAEPVANIHALSTKDDTTIWLIVQRDTARNIARVCFVEYRIGWLLWSFPMAA